VASRLQADLPISDLTVADPPIEGVIDEIFNKGMNDGNET
jgi:ABC-type uncharacterized transport system ATPase subunit